MSNLRIVLLIVTLSLLSHQSDAVCCRAKRLLFRTKQTSCEDYDGARNAYNVKGFQIGNFDPRRCSIHVCDDGKPVSAGTYCGVGSCNLIGCNCEGGCLQGNPRDNFVAFHGEEVYDVKH